MALMDDHKILITSHAVKMIRAFFFFFFLVLMTLTLSNKRCHDQRDEIEATLVNLHLLSDVSVHVYYLIVLRNLLSEYLALEMRPLWHIKGSRLELMVTFSLWLKDTAELLKGWRDLFRGLIIYRAAG